MATADTIRSVSYDSIDVPPGQIFSFEGFRTGEDLFTNFPNLLDLGTLVIGERFRGQTVFEQTNQDGFNFDYIRNEPSSPLRVVPGGPKRNLSIELKSEFSSDVLYGVGAEGVENAAGAGEGTVAIMFDEDVCKIGLITLLEEPNISEAVRETFGKLNITFYARDATVLGTVVLSDEEGIIKLGFEQIGGERPMIAGVLIQNFDKGGAPIDDLKISSDCDLQIS